MFPCHSALGQLLYAETARAYDPDHIGHGTSQFSTAQHSTALGTVHIDTLIMALARCPIRCL
eukprot:9479314-Pyramimonas_sp.AAC.1